MTSERQLTDLRSLVSDLYTLGATIGKGNYAVVKLARHIFTQRDVAVKVINKTKLDDISKAHLFQEVMCMKLVQHPNIVRLYDVIDTPNQLYLILEFGDGGDMYDYIMKHANGLNESMARRYFQQICRGLKYCHEMRVCHRDLKPENLVFFEKQGVVKLTDFGFSIQFSPGKKLLTSCGSLAYSAPEILLGDPYDAAAVDIWSLGVILFMLVTGRAPFQEANDSETVMVILDCSYQLPATTSTECQNLIHRMIVRDPEQRATLDEVMSDVWYQQSEDDANVFPVLSYQTLLVDDHQTILRQMIDGNIAEQEVILKALHEDQYNYVTATYYLLAEKIFYEKFDHEQRTVKRQRRSVQQTPSNLFSEQIGVMLSPASLDKENQSPPVMSSRHSIDSSSEQTLTALIEDEIEDERPLTLQQRTASKITTTTSQATSAQAMRIILEEDETPESPPADKTVTSLRQLETLPKLNKIVESGGEYESASTANRSIRTENSTTTSGVLRSKDLRSVIEVKRRNLSRSQSSSDSEENANNYDMNRSLNRKHNHSPNSSKETESIVSTTNHRDRSFSCIDHISGDTLSSNSPQTMFSSNHENIKRRSFSRTSSTISNSRVVPSGTHDDNNTDISRTNSFIFLPDRTRSLSIEHRLANPSQMSIASRISIRYSTPRESTVFTKTDAPVVIRLLQQTSHQDTTEAIRTIIEHQQSQSSLTQQQQIQKATIAEEDPSQPLISICNTTSKALMSKKISDDEIISNGIEITMKDRHGCNGHMSPVSTSSRSVLSTVKYSMMKHQQRKSTLKDLSSTDKKQKCTPTKHRACCIVS